MLYLMATHARGLVNRIRPDGCYSNPPACPIQRYRSVTNNANVATCGGNTPIQSLEHFWHRNDRVINGRDSFAESILIRVTCDEDGSPLEVSAFPSYTSRLQPL